MATFDKVRKYLYGGPGYFMDPQVNSAILQTYRKVGRKVANGGLWLLGKIGDAFNTALTAGATTDFGLTSPFTFPTSQERTTIQRSRELVRQKAKRTIEQASPYISPSNHITAWTQGSWNPMVGALRLQELGPGALLLGAVFDIATFAKAPKVFRRTGGVKKVQGPFEGSTAYLNDPVAYRQFIDRHIALLKKMEEHPENYARGAIERQRANIAHHEEVYKSMIAGPPKPGPIIAEENLPGIMGPIFGKMKDTPHITFKKGPYVEQEVGGERIIPVATFDRSLYSLYRAQRMQQLLRDRGFDIDEMGFYLTRPGGSKIIGSPRKIIDNLTSEPSTIYITREPNNTGGFYVNRDGTTYVKVRNNPYDMRSTDTHERTGHATQTFLNDITRGELQKEYQSLSLDVRNAGFRSEAASGNWDELRSTLFEMHKRLADAVRNSVKGDYKAVEDYVNQGIDKMSYQTFADLIEGINAYGKDYAAYIRLNPREVGRFKNLLKNGLMWGTPLGLGLWDQ